MYFLNNDGTLVSDIPINSIDSNPIEIDIVRSTSESSVDFENDIIEPHMNSCKCMNCFVKHKIRNNFTYTNIFTTIVFLIIIYLIYMLLVRLFM